MDGDGVVSNQEKQYLNIYKKKMEEYLWKNTNSKSMNRIQNVNDVIESIETFNETYLKNKKEDLKQVCHDAIHASALQQYSIENDPDYLVNTNISYGRSDEFKYYLGILNWTKFTLAGYSDKDIYYSFDSVSRSLNKDLYEKSFEEVYSAVCALIDCLRPETGYYNYIKNANLSKEKLQEILDKINSASSSVQSRLSEVKIAVQQKLEAMK